MKTYPLFKVHVNSELALKKIKEVFESGFINEGTQVTQLTTALSELMQSNKLILVNSCTSAITLALHLAGASDDTEVITTPMTCVASNTPIVASGAKIVWADVDPSNGMIDPQDVLRKITSKTKAVIAVAWAGCPPELSKLKEVCLNNNIKLILDAAHAFDAKYRNQPIHVFADYTCYSFQAIKHFTTGDGGALICSSNFDFERSKALKWFGLDRDKAKDEKGDWKGQQWDVDIKEAGYKFNMNNVSAAIGLSQLGFVDLIMSGHRDNAAHYDAEFAMNDLITPIRIPHGASSSHWVYTVKLSKKSKLTRDELLRALNNEGIMAGVVHVPNDSYTAFSEFQCDLPGVREFSENQLSLPCGWWLFHDDIQHISSRVKELIK